MPSGVRSHQTNMHIASNTQTHDNNASVSPTFDTSTEIPVGHHSAPTNLVSRIRIRIRLEQHLHDWDMAAAGCIVEWTPSILRCISQSMRQVRPTATPTHTQSDPFDHCDTRTMSSSRGLLTSTFPFLSSARTFSTSPFSLASQSFFAALWSLSASEFHGNMTVFLWGKETQCRMEKKVSTRTVASHRSRCPEFKFNDFVRTCAGHLFAVSVDVA
jgi:hypothetical protein